MVVTRRIALDAAAAVAPSFAWLKRRGEPNATFDRSSHAPFDGSLYSTIGPHILAIDCRGQDKLEGFGSRVSARGLFPSAWAIEHSSHRRGRDGSVIRRLQCRQN